MKYQSYDFKSYKVHTIKTDKFKNGLIEFSFRNNIDKEQILETNMLTSLLGYSSKKYPKNKLLVMEKENLYNFSLRSVSSRLGSSHLVNVIGNFLDPKYCDKGYINEVMDFMFEVIFNPNIVNDEFEHESFKVIKNDIRANIESFADNSNRYAFYSAANHLDPDNPIAINFDGSLEQLELITPAILYKKYLEVINNWHLDIYIVGNLDMDLIVNKITKYIDLKSIKNYEVNTYNNVSVRNKVLEVVENSKYEQAKLLICYNLIDVDDYEKNVVMYVFNYILGGGSLSSKLIMLLRETNSLCYTTSSIYQKLDSIITLYSGIDHVNYKKATKLSKQAVKEMQSGDFSDKELEEAKIAIVSSARISQDNIGGVITDRFFNNLCNTPLVDEFIPLIKKVTREDVIKVAKKLKLNLVYLLSNEGDK